MSLLVFGLMVRGQGVELMLLEVSHVRNSNLVGLCTTWSGTSCHLHRRPLTSHTLRSFLPCKTNQRQNGHNLIALATRNPEPGIENSDPLHPFGPLHLFRPLHPFRPRPLLPYTPVGSEASALKTFACLSLERQSHGAAEDAEVAFLASTLLGCCNHLNWGFGK